MSERRPIVLDEKLQLQRLQPSDNLDIPLEQRFQDLQKDFVILLLFLLNQGFEIPQKLVETIEQL